jgi:hypothetical protein
MDSKWQLYWSHTEAKSIWCEKLYPSRFPQGILMELLSFVSLGFDFPSENWIFSKLFLMLKIMDRKWKLMMIIRFWIREKSFKNWKFSILNKLGVWDSPKRIWALTTRRSVAKNCELCSCCGSKLLWGDQTPLATPLGLNTRKSVVRKA